MNATLNHPSPCGTVAAPTSKSVLHRALFAAALSNAPSVIFADCGGDDILATVDALTALGAKIRYIDGKYAVSPIGKLPVEVSVSVKASGTTLRFLLPLCAALGISGDFICEGVLSSRPILPLAEALSAHGADVRVAGSRISVRGKIGVGEYRIRADVSSQFVSGLCLALSAVRGKSRLILEGNAVSRPYLLLTKEILRLAGVGISDDGDALDIDSRGIAFPREFRAEGDWSCAAFFLAMGAIGSHPVSVSGLSLESLQGDAAILEHLKTLGAVIDKGGDTVTVSPAKLRGATIDLADTPDLFPPLAVLAAVAEGETVFTHTDRLKFKESNRLFAVSRLLSALGIECAVGEDTFTVFGGVPHGGTVDAMGDHRIVMSAAALSTAVAGTVTVLGADAVSKSYPAFFSDFQNLLTDKEALCPLRTETI